MVTTRRGGDEEGGKVRDRLEYNNNGKGASRTEAGKTIEDATRLEKPHH